MIDTIIKHLPIHYIETRDENGDACFFLLRASQANATRLAAKKGRDPIDIRHYGEIIESGFGIATPAMRAHFEATYHIRLSTT